MSRVWRGRAAVEVFVIVQGDEPVAGPGTRDVEGLVRELLSGEGLDLTTSDPYVQAEAYVGETEVLAEMEELTPDG